MKPLLTAALIVFSAPAFAGGVVIDLPTLTWPVDAPAEQGCAGVAPATTCSTKDE